MTLLSGVIYSKLGRDIGIKNGCHTRFWKDNWLYQQPLCEIAPVLFALCDFKDVMVDQVRNGDIVITFRRRLPRYLRLQWEQIWSDVLAFHLGNDYDTVLWSLEKNNNFSVKSMYNALTRSDARTCHKMLWKGKILAKIKLFMWLLMNDAILTKDLNETGKETLLVTSVMNLKTSHICSFNVM